MKSGCGNASPLEGVSKSGPALQLEFLSLGFPPQKLNRPIEGTCAISAGVFPSTPIWCPKS
jgi:hypothetical protein